MPLTLHNPHSVLAVFESRPQDVVEIRLGSRNPSSTWSEVSDRGRTHRVPVSFARRETPKQRRSDKRESDDGRNGTSSAVVKERADLTLEQLFGDEIRGSGQPFYVAFDCLHDPHNVGAIFRTAAFFGVTGIVITKDRSAPLSATVYDVASGGLEYVPFAVQANLSRALDVAKKSGMWILGTSEHAEQNYDAVPLNRPWLLVLGNEEKGMRRRTAEHGDETCRIAPQTPVSSLNVSVAAGILIARFARST